MARAPYSVPGLVPFQNPVSDWVAPRRNALLGFGAGLLSPNLGDAATGAMQGMALDRQIGQQQQDYMQAQEETNATKDWLRQRGREDLIPLVDAGQGMFALQQATAKPDTPDPFTLSPGQVRYGPNGEIIAQGGPDIPSAPSGYTWTGNGQLTYIPGGPNDPSMASNKPPTDAQRKAGSLYTVVAPDAELLLGDGTKPGAFDALGDGGSQAWNGIGVAGINPLAGLASSEFQSAKDAVTNIAQSYLYAMSGAAAPAEEVKKIADLVTPNPGDSTERKAEKRRRLESYVQAIQNSTIQPPSSAASGDGWVDAGNGIRIRELP